SIRRTDLRRAYGHGGRKHSGWHQDMGGDVPLVADLAGPQRESAAIQGRHCRGCRRPQRADPLQDVLGHGDRGKAVEKERAQGRGRTENRGTPGERLVAPKIRLARSRLLSASICVERQGTGSVTGAVSFNSLSLSASRSQKRLTAMRSAHDEVGSCRVCDIARLRMDFRFRWKSSRAADITPMAEVDPKRTSFIPLQSANFRAASFYVEQFRCDCAGYKPGPRRPEENGCGSRLHQFAAAQFAPR